MSTIVPTNDTPGCCCCSRGGPTKCQIVWIVLGLIILLFFLCYVFAFEALLWLAYHIPGTTPAADTNRDLFQIIESRGFQYESHFVKSPDGYIINVVRLVNPYRRPVHAKPVFLQHGLQNSATAWLIAREGRLLADGRYQERQDGQDFDESPDTVGSSLGFVLSARGYDVWLGNYRGNKYSINHTTLQTDDPVFWRFSMDEMAKNDLPAVINYVTNHTGQPTMAYAGHSLGSFIILALLSERPEYSAIVKPVIAISPVFHISRSSLNFPAARLVPHFIEKMRNWCETILMKRICFGFLYMMTGMDYDNYEYDRIGVYIGSFFQGASSWAISHFIQIMHGGGIPRHFDAHGNRTNLPDIYNASKINSTQLAFIYSINDNYLNYTTDVAALKQNLTVKLIMDHLVVEPSIGHHDLLWSKNAGEQVNRHVLDLLSRYHNDTS